MCSSKSELLELLKQIKEISKKRGHRAFHQLIESPTRETLTTTTLIDHIATTNKSNIVSSGIHKSCLSDHYFILTGSV